MNIVLFVLDDVSKLDLQIMRGGLLPITTERIIAPGVEFANAFVTQSLCGPSRATIFSGKYPHNHGVRDNSEFLNFAESDTIATRLWNAGYHTALVGKYLNGYGEIEGVPSYQPPGWSEWAGFVRATYSAFGPKVNLNGVEVQYGPTDYVTDVVGDLAAEAVTTGLASGSPLFLYVAPSAAHIEDRTIAPTLANGFQFSDQWLWTGAPRPADQTEKADRWAAIMNMIPFIPALFPSYNEADIGDKPAFLRLPAMTAGDRFLSELQWRRRLLCLLSFDDVVQKVVAALGPAIVNTVFVLTSDNGFANGQHRRSQKVPAYEESIRVPLFIAGPGIAPRSEPRIALNNDIYPTVLDLAGVEPGNHDGRSLRPLIENTAQTWRKRFLIEHKQASSPAIGMDLPTFSAIRTGPDDLYPQRLYVEYVGGEREHYALAIDPFQTVNTATTAPVVEITNLHAKLEVLKASSGSGCQTAED